MTSSPLDDFISNRCDASKLFKKKQSLIFETMKPDCVMPNKFPY